MSALHAFSLVEILVAVSLLSFIVIGLLMTFNQTQRAFRGSMTQTDVLESGRIFTDMISRELEQAGPSKSEIFTGPNTSYPELNFLIEPCPYIKPALQGLPGSSAVRTNQIQQFFFLSRMGQDWVGTGYVVLTNQTGENVGALYRFSETVRPPFGGATVTALSNAFWQAISSAAVQIRNNGAVTNDVVHRVADGIVHLQLRTFSPNGLPLLPLVHPSHLVVRLPNRNFDIVDDAYYASPSGQPASASFYFYRDAVPGSVEIEVGVLEQNILGRYRAMAGNAAAQRNYLSNRVANVHIFRQRIPLRNVDTSVYP